MSVIISKIVYARARQIRRVKRRIEVSGEYLRSGIQCIGDVDDVGDSCDFLNAREPARSIVGVPGVDVVWPGNIGESADGIVFEIQLRASEAVADLSELITII